ncbi:probable protein arginine N-methyltransferase 3 [Rutidosis leptorrhynchoides]|uniref:probable protein arginine N-methyltransferase 3 n=1 Tax=Rutidosis leptorrhynchoides TaxID=125765 RepID=UPI003A99C51F
MAMNNLKEVEERHRSETETETDSEEEDNPNWDDWREDNENGGEGLDFLCLFCDSKFGSCDSLFDHCCLTHQFDFHHLKKSLNLDFYGAFKLINYIRAQVSENKCWSCGVMCHTSQDLQKHLHGTVNYESLKLVLEDEKFLKPFIQDDSLLYSFSDDEDGEDDFTVSVNKEEIMKDLISMEDMSIDDEIHGGKVAKDADAYKENEENDVASSSNGYLNVESSSGLARSCNGEPANKHLIISRANRAAKSINIVNEDYFGSYSSFGIHRDMLSDKVRMDAYSQAILRNPSLFKNAFVMDVGCGTGILSLFAAQAGASRVIAVEASEKMAAVATQIAKDNHLLANKTGKKGICQQTGVVEVVQSMVEELHKSVEIQPHSVDVLLSEWMGYCLLYESMLSSVLFARDQWLKPGGAILPDTASILWQDLGNGVTSLPFWENVYGFNMSCIGKEQHQDASQIPIVDYVKDGDLVTDAVVLQVYFDLLTMKHDEVDFTSSIELEPKSSSSKSTESSSCYGLVLWFDTGFTSRFCGETQANLSTSPYTPETHWYQTILTFKEPIVMGTRKADNNISTSAGTDNCPAAKIHLRISIARAVQHRSIDISMETTAVGADGRKHSWPVQIFNLG